jgi:hypothetical protein
VRAILGVLVVLAGVQTPGAVELRLGLPDIERALAIGTNRSERERERFHATYRVRLGTPPLDSLDVVTPFRRIVLMAEETTRAGNRVGQREALALLERTRDDLELRVELTFHPLNTYVGVPAYEVELRGGEDVSIKPRQIDRVPRFGPRVAGIPGNSTLGGAVVSRGGEPVLGGTVVATFDPSTLDWRGSYTVSIVEAGKELASTRLELAGMR